MLIQRTLKKGKLSSFRILVLLILVFAAGCATLRRQASELLDKKEYGEALRLYEEILSSSPNDAEALTGRTKARLGLVQKDLLEVRFLRLGGQQDLANENLLRILTRVQDWNIFPEGAVASTQLEEMTFASRAVEIEARAALEEGQPFRSQILLRKWGKLFPSERMSHFQTLRQDVQKSGIEICKRWTQEGKDLPYFLRFAIKTCAVWHHFDFEPPTAPELFAWLEPKFHWTEGTLDPSLETALKDLLQGAFRESPWYENTSNAVAFVQVDPLYRFREVRRDVQLTHGYLVQVPYNSDELVELHDWVPDDHTVTVTDLNGHARTEVQRGSRMVTKKEMRSITRIREEVRSIQYPATQIQVSGELTSEVRFQSPLFDEARKSFSFHDEKFLVQHSNSSPEVRLSPQSPRVPTSGEFFLTLADRLSADFKNDLISLWKKQYCRTPKGKWYAVAESVQRCLVAIDATAPDFVEQWMQRELGISYSEMRLLARESVPASKDAKNAISPVTMPAPNSISPSLAPLATPSSRGKQVSPLKPSRAGTKKNKKAPTSGSVRIQQ